MPRGISLSLTILNVESAFISWKTAEKTGLEPIALFNIGMPLSVLAGAGKPVSSGVLSLIVELLPILDGLLTGEGRAVEDSQVALVCSKIGEEGLGLVSVKGLSARAAVKTGLLT